MIIHRTSYVFYDKTTDEPKLIADMKRSQGNRKKIIHKINPVGDIIQSKVYDMDTESFVDIPTSPEMTIVSQTQRKWITNKHKILKSQNSNSEKTRLLNIESQKHFGKNFF